jgi:hypothetical protein
VTAVAEACAALTAALPRAQALTTRPDTTGATPARARLASRPPWNAAAANALYDALEGARRTEAAWRCDATRRSVAATGTVLASIVRLSYGLDPCPPPEYDVKGRRLPCRCQRCTAIRSLTRWATAILQLPAVDEEERPQRVNSPCPYCQRAMLRVYPRSGRVTCLSGDCADGDGRHPVGHADRNRVTGDAIIAWNDGLVT